MSTPRSEVALQHYREFDGTKPVMPEVDDERLAALAERIKPLIRVSNGKLFHIEPVDLRRMAYTWSPKVTVEAEPLEAIATVDTLHSYGAPVFFKPSVAEVIAQIPEEVVDTIAGFSLEGPLDMGRENAALQAGYHVARTTLYREVVT